MEERMIIFDPLKHGTILGRIKTEFGIICILRGQDDEYIRRCRPTFEKVCAEKPITLTELQDLLSEMHHQLLRPLKTELAQLDNP